MKPKSIRRFAGFQSIRPLALVTTITAFAAGSVFAAQYKWVGTTDTDWTKASNYTTGTGLTAGPAPTGGTTTNRLSVNNTNTNSATYNFPGVTTTYGADAASGSRGLVIGSGSNGSMVISGGTFSTLGGVGQDIIGNGTGFAGKLTIDGTTTLPLAGDAHYIGTNVNTDMGLGWGSFAELSIKNGSATVAELRTNNTTATINLETGGTLAMNKLTYLGGGTNNINFNGGTLKARAASTSFIGTTNNGWTNVSVKAGGAIIDTDFHITIARPLESGVTAPALDGGLTKKGTGILTLSAVSTTTGPAVVNAGGLGIAAGTTSWKPSSFTHSGNVLNFNLGVYTPSNVVAIDTAGAVSFSIPNTTVNVTGSPIIKGKTPLIKYATGNLSGFINLSLAPLPTGVVATLKDDGAGLIYLDVTQGGFVWSGATATPGTGDWDITSSNWNNFTSIYEALSPVVFPTITGGGTVTIPADVTPAAVDFTNTAGNDYILDGAGKITGSASVNKTGNGKVTLNNTNTYSGNTNINSGILSIATTGTLPGWNASSRYTIANGATLAVQNAVTDADIATMLSTGNFGAGAILGFDTEAADRTYAANLTGALGVANVGLNILTISGTNSHTGTTLVASGSIKAGSSTAFKGTGPLVMNASTSFDLDESNATFTTINAGDSTNSITAGSGVAGTSTFKVTNGGSSFLGVISDGPTRKVAVKCGAGNASNVPNNADNTYSGGLTLLGAIAPATTGVRLLPYDTFTTVDSETGLVTSGPYGTGPITVGETSADKVQIYFQAANRTIANDIIVNTAAGTDTAGTFRVESIGHTLSGAIVANEASAFFRNNTTGGSAGIGAITLTGPVSTGSNPASGLTVNAAGANALSLTLNNQTAVANSYTGNTTITGANTTLILGAADQIPNGPGKGNVAMTTGKLDLAGFDETINGLSGTGTIDNLTAGSDNTLTLGDGNATGAAFSGVIANTNNTLALIKTGSGTQPSPGSTAMADTTTVNGGTLLINGDQSGARRSCPSQRRPIGGTGKVGGVLTVAAAGKIAPGTVGTVGTLTAAANTIPRRHPRLRHRRRGHRPAYRHWRSCPDRQRPECEPDHTRNSRHLRDRHLHRHPHRRARRNPACRL